VVPTVALELRLITELYRGREDRYRPLLSFMRANGCDLNFIVRGIETVGLAPALKDEVLRALV
jgi:hypothetical protein